MFTQTFLECSMNVTVPSGKDWLTEVEREEFMKDPICLKEVTDATVNSGKIALV